MLIDGFLRESSNERQREFVDFGKGNRVDLRVEEVQRFEIDLIRNRNDHFIDRADDRFVLIRATAIPNGFDELQRESSEITQEPNDFVAAPHDFDMHGIAEQVIHDARVDDPISEFLCCHATIVENERILLLLLLRVVGLLVVIHADVRDDFIDIVETLDLFIEVLRGKQLHGDGQIHRVDRFQENVFSIFVRVQFRTFLHAIAQLTHQEWIVFFDFTLRNRSDSIRRECHQLLDKRA